MAVPKSVVRINKNGVRYVSEVDKCSYYIHELSRAALRDVGTFIKKTFRAKYYMHFKRHTGKGGGVITNIVYSNEKTKFPRMEIGLNASKFNKPERFYGFLEEFGGTNTPRMGLLKKSAYENIDEIIKIESQYLSALNGSESSCSSKIDEKEYEGSADE